MRALVAPLILIAARVRRRPGRFALPVLGLALATAFACAVAAEGVVAGGEGARSVLAALGSAQKSVRINWDGPATAAVDRRARALLRGLGLPPATRAVLLNPVRLDGVVVRLAAITPLRAWLALEHTHPSGSPFAGGANGPRGPTLGPCTARDCPVLLAGGRLSRDTLGAPGVRLRVVGTGTLSSAAPLGFTPPAGHGMPLLLTPDAAGLDSLPALISLYRVHGWLAPLPVGHLQSWDLSAAEGRLVGMQAALGRGNAQYSLSAPFAALDRARAEASAAPQRLLAAGGGAVAALTVFVILAAYGLRHDQAPELERLRIAGARTGQRLTFALGEAAALSAAGLGCGAALGIAAGAVLASRAGLPVSGVLTHSLLTWTGAAALGGAGLASSAIVGAVLVGRSERIIDALALAAVAALALTMTRGAASGGALALLVAPLACLAGGVLIYRGAAAVLRRGERVAHRAPLTARLAFAGLARAPGAPALAIAFVAVSTGLGGFALAYRATLARGAADQAADRVPLDATVSATADFATPLELAPAARWARLAGGGVVAPVRRTFASYAGPGAEVTVPALGVPATALARIHGWRASDGSAPLAALARRLRVPGPPRTPGPTVPAGARELALRARTSGAAVQITAELRDGSGAVTPVSLGLATGHARTLTARLPARRRELEALELDVPAGEEATTGHQNAENAAARTQFGTAVWLAPVARRGVPGSIAAWRAVGAASRAQPDGGGSSARAGRGGSRRGGSRRGGSRRGGSRRDGSRRDGARVAGAESGLVVRFDETGQPGVLRPAQPSDRRPVPVLVDPATATAAGAGGLIALTVDGLPVSARIVGVLHRFPTLSAQDAGFVVADEATLAGALDASLPGQGRPDELWIATPTPRRLAAALRAGPLQRLGRSFRYQVQDALRSEPVAAGTLGTLTAAGGLAAGLALIGLLAALVGTLREPALERDLAVLGLGPRALRRELRVRVALAAVAGVGAGAALALVLTRLAVAAVRAGATLQAPRPELVTVTPAGELGLAALGVLVACAAASVIATSAIWRRRPA